MLQTEVAQHIFGNVEKERSPQKRGGFQTLFYTRDFLNDSEVREVEGRLLYFFSDNNPIKRSFFKISTDKVLVSQITPLDQRDSAGRKGAYLAHSLVFSPDQFLTFGADPFFIFQNFHFFGTTEEALDNGDMTTGDIPTVLIENTGADAAAGSGIGEWAPDTYKKMAVLALNAEQMKRSKKTVVFSGQPEDVEETISLIFQSIPSDLRLNCGFDSYFYRCNLVSTYYWGIGLTNPPRNPNLTVIDIQNKGVSGPEYTSNSRYEKWFIHSVDHGRLDTVFSRREAAFALCQILEGGECRRDLAAKADSNLVDEVFQLNSDKVKTQLGYALQEKVADVFVQRIADRLYTRLKAPELLAIFLDGIDKTIVLDELYAAYVEQRLQQPDVKELSSLKDLLKTGDHTKLKLLISIWKKDNFEIERILTTFPDDEYRLFIKQANQSDLTDRSSLAIAAKLGSFLDVYLDSTVVKQPKLARLIELILKRKRPDLIFRLEPHLAGLKVKELTEIERLLKKEKNEQHIDAFLKTLADIKESLSKKGQPIRSTADKTPESDHDDTNSQKKKGTFLSWLWGK